MSFCFLINIRNKEQKPLHLNNEHKITNKIRKQKYQGTLGSSTSPYPFQYHPGKRRQGQVYTLSRMQTSGQEAKRFKSKNQIMPL